jgi:hypothetical protein
VHINMINLMDGAAIGYGASHGMFMQSTSIM